MNSSVGERLDAVCDVVLVVPRISGGGGAERQTLRLAGALAEEGLRVAIVSRGCSEVRSRAHPAVRLHEVDSLLQTGSPALPRFKDRVLDRLRRSTVGRAMKRTRHRVRDHLIARGVIFARRARERRRATHIVDRVLLVLARSSMGDKARRFGDTIVALSPTTVVSLTDPANLNAALALIDHPARLVISNRSDPARRSYGSTIDALQYLVHQRADVIGANTSGALAVLGNLPEVDETALALTPNIGPDPPAVPHGGGTRRFVVVGRMVESKRPTLSVQRFAEVAPLLPDWELHFIGDGPARTSAEELAEELGVADRVCFHGFVQDVSAMLAEGGILLHLSDFEGTPNAIMEAMAAGLPCITTDSSPGPVELVLGSGEPSGLVCSIDDPEGLATAMVMLATDRVLHERFAEAGLRRAEQATWPALRETWLQLLDLHPRDDARDS